jgi:uncharacterized protein YlxP (DUF503 family)
MQIGICTLRLAIPDTLSLKDKRRVCASLFSKIRQNFNVSIAETDMQDTFRRATVAVVAVNTEKNHLYRTLSKVVSFVEKDYRVRIEDYSIEII